MKKGSLETDTRRMVREEKQKDQGDKSTSQRMPMTRTP